MQELTRHERRLLVKQEKVAQSQKQERQHQIKFWLGALLIIGMIIAGGYLLFKSSVKHLPAQTYTPAPVHWHALVDIAICGQKRDLPKGASGEIGTPLLHSHNDNTIHVEGRVVRPEDIMLGKFFDVIGVPFDKDRIMEKKNDDVCPNGQPGTVKMFVNNVPSNDFRDFVPKAETEASKQVVTIKFD